MAKKPTNITEMRLTVGKTINMGNFNSLRIEVGLSVSVQPGDDIQKLQDAMQDECKDFLTDAYLVQVKKREREAEPD